LLVANLLFLVARGQLIFLTVIFLTDIGTRPTRIWMVRVPPIHRSVGAGENVTRSSKGRTSASEKFVQRPNPGAISRIVSVGIKARIRRKIAPSHSASEPPHAEDHSSPLLRPRVDRVRQFVDFVRP
jgi:hypothetical protein